MQNPPMVVFWVHIPPLLDRGVTDLSLAANMQDHLIVFSWALPFLHDASHQALRWHRGFLEAGKQQQGQGDESDSAQDSPIDT